MNKKNDSYIIVSLVVAIFAVSGLVFTVNAQTTRPTNRPANTSNIDERTIAAFNRGVGYLRQENYNGAIREFTTVIRARPNDMAALNNRGIAYNNRGNRGDYDRAIADFSTILGAEPNNAGAKQGLATAYFYRGNIYNDSGNFDNAIAEYTASLKMAPNCADVLNNRGTAYIRKAEYEKAITDVTAALRIDPNHVQAKRNLEFARTKVAEAEAHAARELAIGAGTFTDSRDNLTYRTIRVGNLTWMAQNLNHITSGSIWYGNNASNGARYGRLYTWDAAMKACPAGWRLPNNNDWNELINAAGGEKIAGRKLKSKTGWSGWGGNDNGTDEIGFAALPGGCDVGGGCDGPGGYGYWWSATETGAMGANYRVIISGIDEAQEGPRSNKSTMFSVRCVQPNIGGNDASIHTPPAINQNQAIDGSSSNLQTQGGLRVSSPDFLKDGQLTGARSRASIQRTVMQNMAAIRHAYNRRLRERPDLSGTVAVKFAVDEFGKVIFAQVVETTMNDSELEQIIVARVRSWDFGKIDIPGDVTEVIYPFVFSQ